jgi:hypothetical protein
VPSVLEIAAELRRALSCFEPGLYPASACARIADELAATEKACGAASLLAARRAVQCGAHQDAGYEDPASWLSRLSGSTKRQAKADLETARLLEDCPATKDAALLGEVSVSQAEAITRGEKETPGAEALLLPLAKEADLSELREKAREHRQGAEDPEALGRAQHEARSFHHFKDSLGMVQIRGALPPEKGIPLVNRIERLAQRLRKQEKAQGARAEDFSRHAADALVALLSNDEPTGPRSPRAELVVVCDLRALLRGHAHEDEPCHLVGGGPIPVGLARELAGDAFVKAVLHDGVHIQTVKHFGRHLPAALRTALDLGEAPSFPGQSCADCGRRYGLEYDHVTPLAAGGPTAYDNLVARCFLDHQAKTGRDRKAGLLAPDRRPGPDQKSRDRTGAQRRATTPAQPTTRPQPGPQRRATTPAEPTLRPQPGPQPRATTPEPSPGPDPAPDAGPGP